MGILLVFISVSRGYDTVFRSHISLHVSDLTNENERDSLKYAYKMEHTKNLYSISGDN